MGGQVVLACPTTEKVLQPFQEVVHTIVNLSWWEWGSPCGFCSELGDFLLLFAPGKECLEADDSLDAIKGWCYVVSFDIYVRNVLHAIILPPPLIITDFRNLAQRFPAILANPTKYHIVSINSF